LHRHAACDGDVVAVVYHPLDVIDENLSLRVKSAQACKRRSEYGSISTRSESLTLSRFLELVRVLYFGGIVHATMFFLTSIPQSEAAVSITPSKSAS
jgi:hypothetical protein